MTEVERLTDFVVSARFGHLSEEAAQQLEIRLLDSLLCNRRARRGAVRD